MLSDRAAHLVGAIRRRVRRGRSRGGILMYHRISEESCDPWAICVSPQAFEEQMSVLADARGAVDVAEFAGDAGFTSSGSKVAVTFDDGYVDNLTAALPVLEKYEVPATLFLVGNAVGRAREFWWDGVQRAVLDSGELPEVLDFPFGAGPHRHRLVQRAGERGSAGWRADSGAGGTARQQLFRTLWDAIVGLEPTEQDDAVDHLLAWAGQPERSPSQRLPVSAEQFAELAAHPLVTLGSHTLDHASLTDLSPARQREQIVGGHRVVEQLAGHRVDRFSYPFGRLDSHARALVSTHVDLACTSVPDAAIAADDRHALPRLQALEMDGDDFGRWLRGRNLLTAGRRHSTMLLAAAPFYLETMPTP